jgi:hypothetical protein
LQERGVLDNLIETAVQVRKQKQHGNNASTDEDHVGLGGRKKDALDPMNDPRGFPIPIQYQKTFWLVGKWHQGFRGKGSVIFIPVKNMAIHVRVSKTQIGAHRIGEPITRHEIEWVRGVRLVEKETPGNQVLGGKTLG